MTINIQTIPDLLVTTRGNQSEVARILEVNRSTVMKYARDRGAVGHIVVNGRLMVRTVRREEIHDEKELVSSK